MSQRQSQAQAKLEVQTALESIAIELGDEVKLKVPEVHGRCCCGIRLVTASEAPKRTVYDHIMKSYRPKLTAAGCVRSLFSMHTETMNVWIHLAAAILFSILCVETFVRHYYLGDFHLFDYLTFGLFYACTIWCFTSSALYHLFNCHSKRLCVLLLRLDMFGCIMHIGGNLIVGLYYFWYCDSYLQRLYLSIIPPVYGLGIVLPMLDCFMRERARPMRMALFLSVALCCAFPVAHWGLVSLTSEIANAFFRSMCATLGYYFLAIFLYMSRIPERFAPGRFDVYGSSHQLWHMFAVAGALTYYHLLGNMHLWRSTAACAL